ncbi:acetylglutamate kinase [Parapedobacter sp. ISTM3]|uniref:Acetylglutamate kinase n=1 Tax=Parapedobacter luteus TaxID=623280 RepID=A0A1T4ZTF9_9SPHI|nr:MULTISPECIES: acetylglutamate kinase [Parapedobacter]MBK1438613.1 acetylglutamate kinase [Parapedobacter sp. ISTM3]SKB25956.1 N-acetylglutamate kinase [Parapedobacter luteus]
MLAKLWVIKIGGNIIDHPEGLSRFLERFSYLKGNKILVHGGGKIATRIAADLGVEAKLVDGRRITDEAMLRIVTMVYAGLTNKQLVAKLQSHKCNAIGLSGADGNAIRAVKRPVKEIDYGLVGDILPNSVDAEAIATLLDHGFVPVFSAITHDGHGQLLNTNADTIAAALAVALSDRYTTSLVYCFEKPGVLRDINDEASVIPQIRAGEFEQLRSSGIIADGMVPKLHNAFEAIAKGVAEVCIGHADDVLLLREQQFGTRMIR